MPCVPGDANEYNCPLTGGVMPHMIKAFLGMGVAALVGGQAAAQGVVMQKTLSLGMAKSIAEATIAACKEKGYSTAAAVVDRAGQVIVVLRDEQASAQTAEMAR